MTILIGYVPTPAGEAALDAGLAEAAVRGDDVVILNSPRRGSTVDADLVDDDGRASCSPGPRSRASPPGSTTPTTAPTSSTTFEALVRATDARLVVIGLRRRSPVGKLVHGQRRAAAAARGSTSRCSRSSPPGDRTGSRGSWSPRSRSRIRRCSTWSASTSRARCGRSSSCTPTPACSGSARRTPTRPISPGSRRSPRALPGHDPYDLHGLRRLVDRRARPARRRRGASASAGCSTCRSARRHRLLPVRGRLPGPRRATRPAARSATCSAARSATGCRSAATSSTSGPATPARPDDDWGEALDPGRRRGAGASGWSTGGGSARSSSRAACFHPDEECAAIEALRDGVPRPAAAARPQRRLDAGDLRQGRRAAGRRRRVPRGPDPRHRRDGAGRRRAPTCRWRPTCA